MNIQRKLFRTEGQKGSYRYVEKTVRVNEGLFFEKIVEKKRKELENVPIMDRVQKFVELVGRENILNISEYRSAHSRIGDDGVLNIAVFYWADSPIEFEEKGLLDD